jgi:hypothetical protein
MSVCRFSEGDVYVYYDTGGDWITCCACRLSPDGAYFSAYNKHEMAAHLLEHRAAGHFVPQGAFEDLASREF